MRIDIMSHRPIFVATHPRACSTAFERVFMTRNDFECIHEPFGDAFYFGPERLGSRYEHDEEAREESGFAQSTYKNVVDDIIARQRKGKQIIIKDMSQYLIPPEGRPVSVAPSLRASPGALDIDSVAARDQRSHTKHDSLNPISFDDEKLTNPTVLPRSILAQFQFAFLIRHPKHSIPSYWRCTIPPLSHTTGFHNFMSCEAGFVEQRKLFDYVRQEGLAGPQVCLIDADDLLQNPEIIMRKFCEQTRLEFRPDMLMWDTEEHHAMAKKAFEKWPGFHHDAIDSSGLHARTRPAHERTPVEDYEMWKGKYGQAAADKIQATVDENLADYLYLNQFAIKAQ